MAIFNKIKSFFAKKPIEQVKPLDKEDFNEVDEYGLEEKPDQAKDYKKSFRVEQHEKNEKDDAGDFDWFADRYQSLVVQRNIAIFLLVIAILCISVTTISLAVITKNKTIEPFVIEIEKKQGLITYVNNNNKFREYTQDEVLRNYFIKQYLDARETFDTKNYDYFYHKVVRRMSSEQVYRQFITILRSNNKDNPSKLLANNVSSQVIITSISILKPKVLQIRFVVEGVFGDNSNVRVNKVAIMEYDYFNLELDEASRYINPLGFIVISYKVSDENI